MNVSPQRKQGTERTEGIEGMEGPSVLSVPYLARGLELLKSENSHLA